MDNEELKSCGCGCGEETDNHDHDCGCGCGEETDNHDHDCGCGCGCGDEEPEFLAVDLEDEDGNIVSCSIVDGFEYKENEYAIVQNPENEAVYLFKVIGEGDDGELVVPEEDEFNEVSAYYEELIESE